MKLNVSLQIEMPDELATTDSMADMSATELLELARHEVEQAIWMHSDADPHQVRVNLLVNGEVQAEPQPVETEVQVASPGVLANGTRVKVTFRGEDTEATVIGFDHKYKLSKVRTTCGKVILRKVNCEA